VYQRFKDKLNLIWRFDFWLTPYFAINPAAPKFVSHFTHFKKWSKVTRIKSHRFLIQWLIVNL
jgi:hypothetical protein